MTDRQPITDNRCLTIRVSRNSLSFSTIEAGEVIYVPYTLNSSISMAANLREAFHSEAILANSYRRVEVMVDTPVLMVPTNLFDEEEQEALYHHAFSRQEQLAVMHTVLPDINAVAVFALQKDLRGVITNVYPEAHFMAAVAPVWRYLHQRSYMGKHQKLFGYFHDQRLEVFSYGQNRFRFCNSYAVNNPNDALYYLLAVWKQLGFEPEHDEMHLAGQLDDREVFITEAQKFVKRVFYINPSGEFNRASVTRIEGMPYDLMILYIKGK